MIYPQRQLDPYEENEVKGTRMPDYSKLARERDIYGELGWINNFNVKFSKNNHKLHPSYREFFDGPKNYHNQFNNSTMTNNEFFRQNAPVNSVARLPNKMAQTSTSGFRFKHKRNSSVIEKSVQMGGSAYATPFLLHNDRDNKHRVEPAVEKSMEQTYQIPFLRSKIDGAEVRSSGGQGGGDFLDSYQHGRSMSAKRTRGVQVKRVRHLTRKEQGWNSYVKPISKYNETVHSSMKIPFERI